MTQMRQQRMPRTVGPRELTAVVSIPAGRRLSRAQLLAIQTVMRLFVDDDRVAGVAPDSRIRCAICPEPRPRLGAIAYGDWLLCNRCALDYEIARMQGRAPSVDRYVRDQTASAEYDARGGVDV